MSFKTTLTLLTLGLCAAAITLAALQFRTAVTNRTLAQGAKDAVPALLDVNEVNAALTAERLRLYAMLMSTRHIDETTSADLVSGFAETDALVDAVLTSQTTAAVQQRVQQAIEPYRDARMNALRASVEPALIRDMSVAEAWLAAARDFERAITDKTTLLEQINPGIARALEETQRLKTALADDAVVLAAVLATRRSFETQSVADMAAYEATFRLSLTQIAQLTATRLPALSGPADRVTETVATTYQTPRAAILQAGTLGGTFPDFAKPETWFEITTATLQAVEAFRNDTFDLAIQIEEARMEQAQNRLVISAAVIVLTLLGSVAAYLVVTFMVVRPIWKTVSVVEELAAGNVDFSLAGFARRHELGALTAAIQSLRDAERQARARRAARMATNERLIADVDKVVSAAAIGDFSHTISLPGDGSEKGADEGADESVDAGTEALVHGVTQLCEIVSHFAHDVDRSVMALKSGNLMHRSQQSYDGLFGDVTNGVTDAMMRMGDVVGDVQTMADRMGQAVEGISSGAADLSTRATQQNALVEASRATMTDLSDSVARNSDAAQDAAQAGQTVSQHAVDSVKMIDRTAETMAQVEKSSKDISEIVALIEDIAFQTNILALNASVEAARAGSAGSGFAIVAQEVRALARRVSEAAMNIGELISTSAGQVRDAAGSVREANTSLRHISEEIASVVAAMQSIAALSQEQSAGVASVAAQFEDFKANAETNQRMADTNESTAVILAQTTQEMLAKVAFFQTEAGDRPPALPDEDAA